MLRYVCDDLWTLLCYNWNDIFAVIDDLQIKIGVY